MLIINIIVQSLLETTMHLTKAGYLIFTFLLTGLPHLSIASGTMDEDQARRVSRADVVTEKDRQRISITAGLLADYEIAGKKMIANLDSDTAKADDVSVQANNLLSLSEDIIKSAQFRLPQCDEYLAKTLTLKNSLQEISHDTLEKDYHHDGALPKAPGECYHTKDLFVHPATVIVLTRDDPSLNAATKASINSEIAEVLGHTEIVRQLVIY